MPLYDFLCAEGHKFERMVPLAEFETVQLCHCKAPADRVISAPMFHVENIGYSCPVTGAWINSRKAHADNLDRQNCRVLEPGETDAASRRRAADDAALDAKIERTVEVAIEAMPSEKKERLANELLSGADASIERRAV